MRLFSLTVTLLASFLVSAAAFAADIEVKMLNKGEEGKMIFEPSFIKAQVGDNIIFLPTDKGHMAASIKGLIPEGAKKFKSKINKKFSELIKERAGKDLDDYELRKIGSEIEVLIKFLLQNGQLSYNPDCRVMNYSMGLPKTNEVL